MTRSWRGPLQGAALIAYLVLVPLLEVQRWPSSSALTQPWLVRGPLVALGLIWFLISCALIVSVLRRRRNVGVTTNGIAWLAGVIVALVSTSSSPAGAATPSPSVAIAATHHEPVRVDGTFHLLPLLLMARIRRDQREGNEAAPDDEIDSAIAADAALDLSPLRTLHHFLAGAPAGITAIPDDFDAYPELDDEDPLVVCRVRTEPGQTIVGYARVGSTLSLPNPWSANQLRDELVGLPNERLSFAATEAELLRALALRDSRTLVVFTGDRATIDDELKQRCVCIDTGAPESSPAPAVVEVRLLQSTPVVLGLSEPFAPTLRRRCIEMVSYLALHLDPVTGDRLRSRVLVHADVDASKGTLLNTATAVRRSLGSDQDGPRLHPVSSAGLYEMHGVTSDIAQFHGEVQRGRRSEGADAAAHFRRALALVNSEPLSATTKGYDWFVLEGHLASLQRDGEWAALSLYEYYCEQGDFDEAFWALRQGLLLDPTNDLLREALYQAPRLRQFGSDGASTAQHQSVGTSGAVAMSWSLERFRR